ncbi:MAG: hypothetical protein BA864_10845 [Desulfuromonadales bacterium C00003093]|nr:MAG: hypothetical protein BA864_10845 [Desulfuromonadales bacterium C00003093]
MGVSKFTVYNYLKEVRSGGKEQISEKYMGDMQFHFGLYTLLKETAGFLEEAEQIASSPPWPVFMRAVNPAYIIKALK